MASVHVDPAKTTRFIVQCYSETAQDWLNRNDRIFVRDYLKPGVSQSDGVGRARAEADKQVSGWQSAFPLQSFRAVPADY